jgi:hypothetical protein
MPNDSAGDRHRAGSGWDGDDASSGRLIKHLPLHHYETLRIHVYLHLYVTGATMMGQVTIYLDDETEKRARDAAESNGVSVSKWIAERIQKDARTEWPTSVRELAGAWPDLPSAEQIRRHSTKDLKRGRL